MQRNAVVKSPAHVLLCFIILIWSNPHSELACIIDKSCLHQRDRPVHRSNKRTNRQSDNEVSTPHHTTPAIFHSHAEFESKLGCTALQRCRDCSVERRRIQYLRCSG
ncbi:unnamed protein product [Ceratitis capitata]|uniref:(Mediterranean fruit fly) hypothetical protein n=1 Tax=Ceratitis capitata TaxID=7213 RepID=A0A811UKM2_CERCA|nr:unnamed protein product [Ceratitis capitata]